MSCANLQTAEGGLRYTLVGVVEHSGQQLASGHYVAYVQRGLQSQLPQGTPSAVQNGSDAPNQPLSAASDSWDDITAALLSSPTKVRPDPQPEDAVPTSDKPLQHVRVPTNSHNGSDELPSSSGEDANQALAELDVEKNDAAPAKRSSNSDAMNACQWYYASDSHVHKVAKERVLGCEAYILLYIRMA